MKGQAADLSPRLTCARVKHKFVNVSDAKGGTTSRGCEGQDLAGLTTFSVRTAKHRHSPFTFSPCICKAALIGKGMSNTADDMASVTI